MLRNLMLALCSTCVVGALSGEVSKVERQPQSAPDVSLQREIAHAIDRGNQWLLGQQKEGGFWSDKDYPALTSLALIALQRDPAESHADAKRDVIAAGYRYLMESVHEDGGIYRSEALKNYNTSVGLLALVVAGNETYKDAILGARAFLIQGQQDYGQKGESDDPLDGGIGYGTRYSHSDMSNTLHALEALYHSRHFAQDQGDAASSLNWDAVKHFLEQCQQLPSVNKSAWVSGDEENRGGFVYFPGNSKAGEMTLGDGTVALRSYGSISYAGLLSYVYADLDQDDPRVAAVLDWLKRHYTLEENPGMGLQGLYFYYHTMTKALTALGIDRLELEDGTVVSWGRDLAVRLLGEQEADGSWKNSSGRWWEADPVLATAYVTMTLEMVYPGL